MMMSWRLVRKKRAYKREKESDLRSDKYVDVDDALCDLLDVRQLLVVFR